MTTAEAKQLYEQLVSIDPESMEELLMHYDLLHDLVCRNGHYATCDEPLDLEWNPMVKRLATMRARVWVQLVFAAMLENDEAGDPHDLDTMTPDLMPPDSSSHLFTT